MFEIVVICTGNRNRSPIVEEALREASQGLPVVISSAGLLDLGSAPPLPETLRAAAHVGLNLSLHRARFIKKVDLGTADLLLGLEWQHVASAVVEEEVPVGRAFTLIELLNILRRLDASPTGTPEERARCRIKLAQERRKLSPSLGPAESIKDPFGGPMEAYIKMATTVHAASGELARRLFA